MIAGAVNVVKPGCDQVPVLEIGFRHIIPDIARENGEQGICLCVSKKRLKTLFGAVWKIAVESRLAMREFLRIIHLARVSTGDVRVCDLQKAHRR